jgi:hypothetical protein
MSPPPASAPAQDRRCHSGSGCRRPPRFRAQLHRADRAAGQSPAVRTVDTCADHLGDTVLALVTWASTTGFGSGILEVSVVGATPGEGDRPLYDFPFATIPLSA